VGDHPTTNPRKTPNAIRCGVSSTCTIFFKMRWRNLRQLRETIVVPERNRTAPCPRPNACRRRGHVGASDTCRPVNPPAPQGFRPFDSFGPQTSLLQPRPLIIVRNSNPGVPRIATPPGRKQALANREPELYLNRPNDASARPFRVSRKARLFGATSIIAIRRFFVRSHVWKLTPGRATPKNTPWESVDRRRDLAIDHAPLPADCVARMPQASRRRVTPTERCCRLAGGLCQNYARTGAGSALIGKDAEQPP
jgi:hypothetical protein